MTSAFGSITTMADWAWASGSNMVSLMGEVLNLTVFFLNNFLYLCILSGVNMDSGIVNNICGLFSGIAHGNQVILMSVITVSTK